MIAVKVTVITVRNGASPLYAHSPGKLYVKAVNDHREVTLILPGGENHRSVVISYVVVYFLMGEYCQFNFHFLQYLLAADVQYARTESRGPAPRTPQTGGQRDGQGEWSV